MAQSLFQCRLLLYLQSTMLSFMLALCLWTSRRSQRYVGGMNLHRPASHEPYLPESDGNYIRISISPPTAGPTERKSAISAAPRVGALSAVRDSGGPAVTASRTRRVPRLTFMPGGVDFCLRSATDLFTEQPQAGDSGRASVAPAPSECRGQGLRERRRHAGPSPLQPIV